MRAAIGAIGAGNRVLVDLASEIWGESLVASIEVHGFASAMRSKSWRGMLSAKNKVDEWDNRT